MRHPSTPESGPSRGPFDGTETQVVSPNSAGTICVATTCSATSERIHLRQQEGEVTK